MPNLEIISKSFVKLCTFICMYLYVKHCIGFAFLFSLGLIEMPSQAEGNLWSSQAHMHPCSWLS